jgi:hypothetical protein
LLRYGDIVGRLGRPAPCERDDRKFMLALGCGQMDVLLRDDHVGRT